MLLFNNLFQSYTLKTWSCKLSQLVILNMDQRASDLFRFLFVVIEIFIDVFVDKFFIALRVIQNFKKVTTLTTASFIKSLVVVTSKMSEIGNWSVS